MCAELESDIFFLFCSAACASVWPTEGFRWVERPAALETLQARLGLCVCLSFPYSLFFFFVFFSCCASLWGEEFLLPASIPHSSMDRVFEGSVCQRGSVALVCIYMCECVCACVSITLHTRQKHKRQESYSGSSSSWVTFQDATGNLCRYVPEANHHSST